MTELWDLVDRDGRKNGIKWARKDHANIPEGMYHPCVEVWVKVGDRVLITQRHPDKSEGLKFDAPGGAVLSGESIEEGAVRELFEEVGIRADAANLRRLGVFLGKRAYAVSFSLELLSLPELTLQPSEVIGYRLVSASELENMADQLCEGCRKRYFIFKNEIF